MALDDALQALETVHPRKSQVVELRYFGGLSLEETDEALHVSVDTVKRDCGACRSSYWTLRPRSSCRDRQVISLLWVSEEEPSGATRRRALDRSAIGGHRHETAF